MVAAEPAVQRLGGAVRLRPALKAAGIYDPDTITLKEVVVPAPPPDLPELSIEEIARLTGDAARGKNATTRCMMCHSIGGAGAEVGPALDGWGAASRPTWSPRRIVRPSPEIAHGYDGHRAQDQGRPDDSGRADQGGRSADDAQHGRHHADHPADASPLAAACPDR